MNPTRIPPTKFEPGAPPGLCHEVAFPNGPLGLTLLPHGIVFLTSKGEEKYICCAIVHAISNADANGFLQVGDILLSANLTSLLSSSKKLEDVEETDREQHFEAIKGVLATAAAPKRLQIFRLLADEYKPTGPGYTTMRTEEAFICVEAASKQVAALHKNRPVPALDSEV